MNCPSCKTGVLEPLGYIPLNAGPLQLHYVTGVEELSSPALYIHVCSKDPCGYVRVEAAPASLSLAKSIFREMRYAKTGTASNNKLPL